MCENETKFEVRDEPYKTRDGRDARVICVDAKGKEGETIIALVRKSDGYDVMQSYHPNGQITHHNEHNSDLMPPMRTVWVNISSYKNTAYHWESEEKAHEQSSEKYIAKAIPVEIPA